MKHNINLKISSFFNLIISLFFLFGVCTPISYADLSSFDQSPYTFGPEGRPFEDLQEYQKPNQMVPIIPYRPVMTRDKYGVRQFWSPSGMLILTMNVDGSTVFQLNGTTINRDASRNVSQISQMIPDSNKQLIHDGQGNYLGYQIIGLGNNVLQQYDANNNLTQSYSYSEFGKTISNIINELTLSRTVFNSVGLPTADINYEGAAVATYAYDDHNLLLYKIDNRGNKTYYNTSNGQMDRTVDPYGNILMKYYYTTNADGMAILNTSVDNNGMVTYYQNGKPQCERDPQGNLCKEYFYQGQTLVYVFDHTMGQCTWYDVNGNSLCTTQNNIEVNCWLYSAGKLVATWDDENNILTAYIRGDPVGTYMFLAKPTAQFIQQLIDEGIIKKNYLQ